MIAVISQFIPLEWLFGAVVALVGLVAAWLSGKRSHAVKAENNGLRETAKQDEAGRKGEAKAKADLKAGKTPEEIVRANDGKWQ
jgi:hypothetical protein